MNMSYYGFYWSDGDFILRIDTDKETVKKLLDEYKKSDSEGYNDFDFVQFLKEKGISVEVVDTEEWFYF